MNTFRKLTVPFTLLGMLTMDLIFLLLSAAGHLYDGGVAGALIGLDVVFGMFWLVVYCYFPNRRILMFVAGALGALASLVLGPAIGIYNMLEREKKVDATLGTKKEKPKKEKAKPAKEEAPKEEPLPEPEPAIEPAPEETPAEEAPAEEPAPEEPAPEEAPAEEPAPEEPKAEEAPEAPAEETPAEEPAAEETPSEEAAAE